MKGTLYIQRDSKGRWIEKPDPIECEIDLGRDGQIIAGVGRDIVAGPMIRARVEFISANGMFISGLEKTHYRGIPAMRYHEWWFVPIVTEREGREQRVDGNGH